MKSRLTALILVLTTVGLLAPAQAADSPETKYKINQPNDFYSVRAEYENKSAVSNNLHLALRIVMENPTAVTIPASEQLSLWNCRAADESKIEFEKQEVLASRENGLNVSVYNYRVKLPAGLEARKYTIRLEFRYLNDHDKLPVERTFPLNVGTLKPDKLKFTAEKETDPLELGILSHKPGFFAFKLENAYPDYPINISRISVASAPAWLIEGVETVELIEPPPVIKDNVITFDPPLTLAPSQEQLARIKLKLGKAPLTKWITGFNDKETRLTFNIFYNDGFERTITSFNPGAEVKVRPNDTVLIGAMLLGVALGTGIKFYLEYLHKRGGITKRGVATFVIITVVVGVVITLIAWGGQIQIIAFKDIELSYDKPVVIGLIGLMGALAGVHYLHGWASKHLQGPTGSAND